jgi:chitodextrinase/GH18 family chitinase
MGHRVIWPDKTTSPGLSVQEDWKMNGKLRGFCASVVAVASLAACGSPRGENTPGGPESGALGLRAKVIGYVPSWRGNVGFVRYNTLTDINYAFLVAREDGSLTTEYDDNLLQTVVSQAHANGVRVLISVGGGVASGALGRAICNTAYPNASATLKANLLQFMTAKDLDGIDLDWEYPQSASEASAFTTFVTSLAADVHARQKLLTAATVGANWVGKYYADAAVDAFDFLNVMAYDIPGQQHSSYQVAVDQLAYWAARGVPASKLVLGVPFYGYPADGSRNAIAYKDVLAADPSAYNSDYSSANGGVYYNGVPTMKLKTQLAMSNASGVMIWELSMDTTAGSASLLDAIVNTMGGPSTFYTVTASAGANGSIGPAGAVSVAEGASQTFTISPSSGYTIGNVMVDGASVGALSTYTFSNVTADHTISVTFTASSVSSNLALGKPATASSVEVSGFPASAAVDGNTSTRWSSQYTDPSWIALDLGSVQTFNRVVLRWEAAYATAYQIQVSSDNLTWAPVYTKTNGTGGVEDFTFASTSARYVRMYGTARATRWGYSLYELEIYGSGATPLPPSQYTISASAGVGGSISPSGAISVSQGASQTFTISPDAGYRVATVTVDGAGVGAVSSYTFPNVTANHTITAAFAAGSSNATGVPGNPHLSHNNWSGESNYTLHMTMWWGNNGSSWEIYENGTLIYSAPLIDNSPNQQDASYDIAGKANGTYAYSCRLINSYGATTSDPITVTVTKGGAGDTTPPSAPTDLISTGKTSSSVSLSWNACTDNVAVTGYVVYYGAGSLSVTDTQAMVTGLTPNTSYTFAVKAKDAANNLSEASLGLTVVTPPSQADTEAPKAPTDLTSTGKTSSSVSLAWTASTDNVGVTGYMVYYAGQSTQVTGTSIIVSGLSSNTNYVFTVKAMDASGNLSDSSATVSVTTEAPDPITEPSEMLFDDFSYQSPDDPSFTANWNASDYSPASPGLGSFSKSNVVFLQDPATATNKLMRIMFTTRGSRETTVQGEVEGQRRFLYGTYASRIRFYNQPISGPTQTPGPDTGDHIVSTFFTISPYNVPNTEYGELDFEYLPMAGWNGDGPRFTKPTMWNTTWKTRDVRLTKATETDCSGWHTFWMTVTPTAISYYMDDTLFVTHTDTSYIPQTMMLLMYNIWLTGEQFASGQSGVARTWAQDVDWMYYAKDTTLTRVDIENAVAFYKSKNIPRKDTLALAANAAAAAD